MLLCVFAMSMLCSVFAGKTTHNPLANPHSVVEIDNTRFTVLTQHLIRMEWKPDKKLNFVDCATLFAVNRYLPTPHFTSNTNDGVLTITTDALIVKYDLNEGASLGFTITTLNITVQDVGGKSVTWKPGDDPTGNLLGTIRTLDSTEGTQALYCPDMMDQELQDNHCELGIVSRDGWVLVDDSQGAQFDDDPEWPWINKPQANSTTCSISNDDKIDCYPGVPKAEGCIDIGCCWDPTTKSGIPWCFWPRDLTNIPQDYYFFGHGHNYKQALADFLHISGEIPQLPRWLYGPQYSRWYAYNENDERKIVIQGFEEQNVPLDVLVLDMDWHTLYYNTPTYCHPPLNSWTGYSWNKDLFPNPTRFISWLHEKGIHVTLNSHPDAGIQCSEAEYNAMATFMGVDPSTNNTITYAIQNKQYANGFMEIVLGPIKETGVDYFWVDYQQGEDLIAPGVNPTWWINYVSATSPSWWSGSSRAALMARWGGLGNHRFGQIGFSGDVTTSWDSLAFQPYFTSTATNVGFAWSHDLGGFEGQPTPELYTRWIQWGTFSPTLRTHCNGKEGFYRDIWLYPYENFKIMRYAYQLRSQLMPYINTANFDRWATGLGLNRPMYYEYPEDDDAYNCPQQYMFGNDMIVAPVTSPGDSSGISVQSIWIPSGNWVELFSGEVFTGPTWLIDRQFILSEIPVYIRAGAVIPMASSSVLGGASQVPTSLTLAIYPGLMEEDWEEVYSYWVDDDGITTDYQTGNYALTYSATKISGNVFYLGISPVSGSFSGLPASRTYSIRLNGVWPGSSVTLNEQSVPFERDTGNKWTYEGETLTLVVDIVDPISIDKEFLLQIEFDSSLSISDPLLGTDYRRKINTAQFSKDELDTQWSIGYHPDDYPSLLLVAIAGRNITVETAYTTLSQFDGNYAQAIDQVGRLASTDTKNLVLDILQMA